MCLAVHELFINYVGWDISVRQVDEKYFLFVSLKACFKDLCYLKLIPKFQIDRPSPTASPGRQSFSTPMFAEAVVDTQKLFFHIFGGKNFQKELSYLKIHKKVKKTCFRNWSQRSQNTPKKWPILSLRGLQGWAVLFNFKEFTSMATLFGSFYREKCGRKASEWPPQPQQTLVSKNFGSLATLLGLAYRSENLESALGSINL